MRLIDADMFEESLKHAQNECRRKEGGNFLFGFLSKVRANLEKMPTVDAVPVVRCKDCKHWDKEWEPLYALKGEVHFCTEHGETMDSEYYCADGERMDGEEDG